MAGAKLPGAKRCVIEVPLARLRWRICITESVAENKFGVSTNSVKYNAMVQYPLRLSFKDYRFALAECDDIAAEIFLLILPL